MTYRFFILGAVSLLLSACWGNRYEIEGLAEGLEEGDTLLLWGANLSAPALDTLVVHEGKFGLRGKIDTVQLYKIQSMTTPGVQALFFAEPGTTVQIHLNADGSAQVGGTEANEAWQLLTDMCEKYGQQAEAMVTAFYGDDISEEELKATTERIRRLNEQKAKWLKEFYERNKDNAMGAFLRNEVIMEECF